MGSPASSSLAMAVEPVDEDDVVVEQPDDVLGQQVTAGEPVSRQRAMADRRANGTGSGSTQLRTSGSSGVMSPISPTNCLV